LEFNLIFMDCRVSEIAMSRAINKLAGGGVHRSRGASSSAIVYALISSSALLTIF
jgi:hypothetical protein